MSVFKTFLKNKVISVLSNVLNLIVTAATALLIPLVLGTSINQYGYYQIYLFYIAYIGFFHLGLCDGILLKEGGEEYCNLHKEEYAFQIRFIVVLELVIALLITLFLVLKRVEVDYLFIGISFGINLIVFLPRNLLAYILQATNRIKENSLITMIGRSTYLVELIILCLLGVSNYKYFIIADLLGKMLALMYAMYKCRDILHSKPTEIRTGLRIVKNNISSGMKLMLASISSMVITGIVQLFIQTHWSVETYGEISLTLSLTNLVLTFISAIAIVLYPTLRRVNRNTATELYKHICSIMMPLLITSLIFCKPLQVFLLRVLPQYYRGLYYLPILFPVCVFSAKFSLLVQTYMQVFRMEKDILAVNVVSILVTLIGASISVYVFNSLFLTVLTILLCQIFRCFYAEYVLSKRILIIQKYGELLEIFMVVAFIICSINCDSVRGMIIYITLYFIYLLIRRKDSLAALEYIGRL